MFIVSSTIAREWLGIDKVIVRHVLLSIHLLLTLRLFFRIGVQVFVLQNCLVLQNLCVFVLNIINILYQKTFKIKLVFVHNLLILPWISHGRAVAMCT